MGTRPSTIFSIDLSRLKWAIERRDFQCAPCRGAVSAFRVKLPDSVDTRSLKLGRISQMTKAQAQGRMAAMLAPINLKSDVTSTRCNFGDFVSEIYFPFYERKWKRSTLLTNKDR